MNTSLGGLLRSWPVDPWLVLTLGTSAFLYLRGWAYWRRRRPERFRVQHLIAFLAGLATIGLALCSPLEPAASLLLSAHMVQHLALMMVAPPLLWLGSPYLPMLWGLPAPVRRHWVAPVLRVPLVPAAGTLLTAPVVAGPLFVIGTWLWHWPAAYELALREPAWHKFEHAVFLATALLFWYPVVQPYPSRPRGSRWLIVPYLLLADVQNTVLAAIFCFSGRVLYPRYDQVPRLARQSPLADQELAGLVMWIPGSVGYLVPAAVIAFGLLHSRRPRKRSEKAANTKAASARLVILDAPRRAVGKVSFDLLRVPGLGTFLRWRRGRQVIQAILLLLAVAVIVDGLTGPLVAPMNLAGVLPWTHWRGLVVLGLLVVGNLFCYACPFTLPRRLARSLVPAGRPWPRLLRSKWLAIGLLALFFWTYEVFALWSDPLLTAALVVGYFLAALGVDLWFTSGSFCKYLCPIGQFHFVGSLASPFEIRVRDGAVCESCGTKDCIRGNERGPGCELGLFLPHKVGNLDCTFCLDCVHACPSGNIGMLATAPTAGILSDRSRAGIGRVARRPDLALLVLLLAFAAFANAALMVGPVVEWRLGLGNGLGIDSDWPIVTLLIIAGIIVLPVLATALANCLSRWAGARSAGTTWWESWSRFSLTLAPLGASMWLVHFAFHFVTSYPTLVPVVQRASADWGVANLGEPRWECGCCAAAPPWLLRAEILALDLGLLASLYLGYRLARKLARGARTSVARTLLVLLPWGVIALGLFGVGIWILFQPMEMRGTMLLGGAVMP